MEEQYELLEKVTSFLAKTTRALVESSEKINNMKVDLEALKAVLINQTTDTAEIKQKFPKSATSLVLQQKRKLPDTASYTPPKLRHRNVRKS